MDQTNNSVPKHEQNFWMDADGYGVFGHYHDHQDWCVMRDHIIDGIVGMNLDRPVRILDVGCGKGWNIQEIADTVLARTRHAPLIHVVEPDSYARSITENLLVPHSYSGLLGKSFEDISQVTDEKLDVVLFMHSGYYIKDFAKEIERLAAKNLDPNGAIMVQTLPTQSPFFLGGRTYLPNTTEEVAAIAANVGTADVERFRSRFLSEVYARNATEQGTANIKRFMDCADLSDSDFMRKFQSFSDGRGDIDLQDDIVWIRPNVAALALAA